MKKLGFKCTSRHTTSSSFDINCPNPKCFPSRYRNERDLRLIQPLIDKDLSEPYSIFTYRYFINQWPDLCYLALEGEECIGAVVSKLESTNRNVYRGYIAMLAVREDRRKMGLGSKLVASAIEAMIEKNCHEVTLEAEVTNAGALRLYENLGFIRDKRLEKYYLNGNDAFRLKLRLKHFPVTTNV